RGTRAPARRPALERRHELHAGARGHEGAARGARALGGAAATALRGRLTPDVSAAALRKACNRAGASRRWKGRVAHPAYDEARRLLARIARLAEPEDEARLAALEAAVAEERQLRLAAERLLAARVLELEVLRRRKEPEEPGEPGQTKPKPRPKGPPIELPRVADEHAYWLRRCEGFRVATGEQTAAFGTVEATCFGHRHDRPDELLVTIGRRRTIALPVA